MADRINYNQKQNKFAFASAIEPAWHGKGQILNGKMTAEEAIREALLDFEVGKLPASITLPDGTVKEIPGKFGTYRMDKGIPFGVVGNRYEIVQNRDAFEFFDAIVGKGEAIYETAGALYDGQVVFITAKLPDYIRVGKDEIEKYIFLKSTHDGSGSVIAAFSSTRICCANTLAAALGDMTNKVSIRHTKDAKLKLAQAHRIMGISNKLSEELSQAFNVMAKKSIIDAQLKELIQQVIAPPLREQASDEEKAKYSTRSLNKINEVFAYTVGHSTQQMESTKGTLFGFLQGITGYYQNVKTWKSVDDKIDSIIDGKAQQDSQKALDLALQLI